MAKQQQPYNYSNLAVAAVTQNLSQEMFPVLGQFKNSQLQLQQSGEIPTVIIAVVNGGIRLAEVTALRAEDTDAARACLSKVIFVGQEYEKC